MKHKAVTRKVGLRRILKLAAFVRKVKHHRFDFSQFVGGDWQGSPTLSCGTTACAFGWATAMPLFRRLGLYLSRRSHQPKLGRETDFEKIAERIFGIDGTETSELFIPGGAIGGYIDNYRDVTPKRWAKFARKWVAKKQRETT